MSAEHPEADRRLDIAPPKNSLYVPLTDPKQTRIKLTKLLDRSNAALIPGNRIFFRNQETAWNEGTARDHELFEAAFDTLATMNKAAGNPNLTDPVTIENAEISLQTLPLKDVETAIQIIKVLWKGKSVSFSRFPNGSVVGIDQVDPTTTGGMNFNRKIKLLKLFAGGLNKITAAPIAA